MQTSLKIIHHNHNNKDLLDEISLSYEERFIRRKKLIANNGTEFLVNLEETVSVDENHFFELENGKIIKVLSKSIIVSPFFSNSNKTFIASFTKLPYFFSLNLKIPKIKLNI